METFFLFFFFTMSAKNKMLEKKNYKNSRVKLLKKKKQTLILKDRFCSFKPKQQFSVGNHGFAFKKCLTKGRTSLYNEKKKKGSKTCVKTGLESRRVNTF